MIEPSLMRVSQRLKFLSDPVATSPKEKLSNTQNSPFTNTKIYSLSYFWVVVGKKKQCMKTETLALAGQRETICHEEKESRDRPWIFFLVFCCCSNMLISLVFFFTGSHLVWDPLSELTSKWGPANFGRLHMALSSHYHVTSTSHQLSNLSRPLTSSWYRREDVFRI